VRRIDPIRGLTLVFLTGLTLLVLVFHGRIPLWRSLLLRYAILAGFLFLPKPSPSLAGKVMGRMWTTLKDFAPLPIIIVIFESLGDVTHYLRPDIDSRLIQIDYALFGVHPTLWMERWIASWFTDVMSLAYVSYYFIPLILVAALYRKDRMMEFDRAVFVLAFGFYVSYIGYLIFPAVGPRYALSHLYSIPLEGSFITDFFRDTLNTMEHNKRDCMPSGHTQIVLMCVCLAYRYEKFLFYIFLPISCALILSTVYLRYHYVVDVLAGIGLAIGCMIIGPRLYEWWKGESGQRKVS
jgi:membrane-associated phospholipid phosphatase